MSTIDRNNPAFATIKERYPLTKEGSSKVTFHITLDLKDCPIHFKVGDSLGIYAQNDPLLVNQILSALGAAGEELIPEKQFTVQEFLTHKANLFRLPASLLELYFEYALYPSQKEHLGKLLQKENRALLQDYLTRSDPLSFFKEFASIKPPLQKICNQFAPLLPRFYSVASSLKKKENEVDLVVALLSFTHSGEKRFGVASHFLCNLATLHKTLVPLYVQTAHRFGLPEKLDAPIIMVGPGTGVAPFRGFLQERVQMGSKGKNWLFFGERNRQFDFFYEDFWMEHVSQELLSLTTAFSRDQDEKLYVQHKMVHHSSDIWNWLQEGAYFYICGDAEKMAKGVEATLQQIVCHEGKMSPDEAKAYIKQLRKSGRYLADIY